MKVSKLMEQAKKMTAELGEIAEAIKSHSNIKNDKDWESKAANLTSPVVSCLFAEYERRRIELKQFMDTEYFLPIELIPIVPADEIEDSTPVMLSDDDKFFLIKAIESGGISDVKSLYEWADRRRKGGEVKNGTENNEKASN